VSKAFALASVDRVVHVDRALARFLSQFSHHHAVTVPSLGDPCMNGKLAPTLDEFRECVLAAYAPVIRTMGFVELPHDESNRFTVRIGDAKIGPFVVRDIQQPRVAAVIARPHASALHWYGVVIA
jgi:hypothetical protein